jgi:hypothetical protein
VRYPVLLARAHVAALIRTALGGRPSAGIVAGLSVGLQDALSREQWQVLARSGTSHLMAISGLHIAMVAAVFAWLDVPRAAGETLQGVATMGSDVPHLVAAIAAQQGRRTLVVDLDAMDRNLQRMGINPNSGRMAALNNQLMVGKALGTAQAANSADENRRTQGVAMRQQASNLAQGFPAQSMGQAGQAGQFGSSAAGIGGQGLGYQMQNQGAATQGMGAVGNMYGNNASGYNQQYGTQVNAWGQGQQAASSSAAGWGALAGTAMMMFADGGKVGGGTAGHTGKNLGGEGGKIAGPGTGTSDQVTAVNRDNGQPIRLSNGEYIIPADVVKAKGVEFFDKLKEKYHTPVQGRNLGSQA